MDDGSIQTDVVSWNAHRNGARGSASLGYRAIMSGGAKRAEELGDQVTPTHTALIVPVPAASDICLLLDDGSRLRMTAPVAHITIATPFVRE